MCNDLTQYIKLPFARASIRNYIFVLVGFSVFSFMVDILGNHASDGVFAMERTGSQLFSWCEPDPHPATIAIHCSTPAHQTVVCMYS